MIQLFENEKHDIGRQSSKGNQLKFYRDGIWYKADYLGYEGLVEYTISKLLTFSNLNPDEYVNYELEQIEYNGTVFNGCKSKDFTDGWNLITLERLFKNVYGMGLNNMIYSIEDHEERLKALVNQTERTTNMLTIDSIFLNEDRHTHNIAVLANDKNEFKLAPIFDNGAGLLSDTMMEYPLSGDTFELMKNVKSKTFVEDFEEQTEISEKLYGSNIHFSFKYEDICRIVNHADIYDEKTRNRVIETITQMRRRYSYLFS